MKRPSSSTAPIPASIRQAAAAWVGLRDGGLTASQEADFLTWLEADKRHAVAFAEIDDTWNRFDRLETEQPALGEPDPDLLFCNPAEREPALSQPSRAQERVGRFVLPAGLAAAAALAIGYLGWWAPAHVSTRVLAGDFTLNAATEVGASKMLDLPDGSVLRLNTDTTVEVAFSAGERRVRLVRGEAHFAVAKNPARPFIVSASLVDVRAVGTAFNVRMNPAVIEVLVTEGKVRVNEAVSGRNLLAGGAGLAAAHEPDSGSPAPEPLLARGERATIALTPTAVAAVPVAVAMVPPEESARALAWQDERLEFASTPLAEVVAQFNRYNRHQLVVADSRLHDLRFGGTFRCNGYDAFVRLLESHFGVTAERRESETLLRLAP